MRKMLLVLALICVWWFAAVAASFSTRGAVALGSEAIYPYAFAFTCLSNICCAVIQLVVSWFVRWGEPPKPGLQPREVAMICLIGVFQGASVGFSNMSLEYLTVSARVMLLSSSVLFQMVVAYAMDLEGLGARRCTAALLFLLGGVVQWCSLEVPDTEVSLAFWAVAAQVIAMTLGALQWATAQYVMQRVAPCSALAQMSKLRLAGLVMPVGAFVCLLFAAVFEPGAFEARRLANSELHRDVLCAAIAIAVLSFAEYFLVYLTSAVCLQVLNVIHQVPIAFAGVIVFSEPVNLASLAGFSLSIVGGLVYASARRTKEKPAVDGHEAGNIGGSCHHGCSAGIEDASLLRA